MLRTYIRTEHELQDWFFERDCTKLAFDTETSSLDYSEMEILGMSFCDGVDSCYIDLDVDEHEKMITFLSWIFQERVKRLIAHNIQFDMQGYIKLELENTQKTFSAHRWLLISWMNGN